MFADLYSAAPRTALCAESPRRPCTPVALTQHGSPCQAKEKHMSASVIELITGCETTYHMVAIRWVAPLGWNPDVEPQNKFEQIYI